MGKINFLQGGYTGTLGETYGVKQRRTVFVKARPFSHTPHNTAQKNSFTAFSCLQRFCAQVNKSFWYYTGLSDKNRNKMNVTAEYFKAMVSEHLFKFEKVAQVVPETDALVINSFEFQESEQTFKIGVTVSNEILVDTTAQLFVGTFVPDGRSVGALVSTPLTQDYYIPTIFTNKTNAYAVALLSIKKQGKRGLVSSSFKALKSDIVIGETLFPNVIGNGLWEYIDPELLEATGAVVAVEGEKLVI